MNEVPGHLGVWGLFCDMDQLKILWLVVKGGYNLCSNTYLYASSDIIKLR